MHCSTAIVLIDIWSRADSEIARIELIDRIATVSHSDRAYAFALAPLRGAQKPGRCIKLSSVVNYYFVVLLATTSAYAYRPIYTTGREHQ